MARIWSTPVSFPFDKEQLLAIVRDAPRRTPAQIYRVSRVVGVYHRTGNNRLSYSPLLLACGSLCQKKRRKKKENGLNASLHPTFRAPTMLRDNVDLFLFPFLHPCGDFLRLNLSRARKRAAGQLNFRNPGFARGIVNRPRTTTILSSPGRSTAAVEIIMARMKIHT